MFELTSVLPYFLIMGLLLVLATGLARRLGFYRSLLQTDQPSRFQTLDGLRGYLALAVFFHHAAIQKGVYVTGKWQPLPPGFYRWLGPTAVMFFFMITGFLFWSKAMAKGGRLSPMPLYRNRFWRLAPLYALSMVLLLGLVAEQSRGRLLVPPLTLATQVLRTVPLGLTEAPCINTVDTIPLNGGVTWTLRYEWLFYLALPLLAVLATPTRFAGLAAVTGFLCAVSPSQWLDRDKYCLFFLSGMLAAHLVASFPPAPWVKSRWLTPVSFLFLTGTVLWKPWPWGVLPGLLAFLTFVYGNDLCGLLTRPGPRLLGTISYSIYLLHAMVLWVGLRLANRLVSIAALGGPAYWLVVSACAVAVVACSALTYRFVEHPFLLRSHRRPAKSLAGQAQAVQMKIENEAYHIAPENSRTP